MNDRPESEDAEIERLRAEAADLRGRIDRLEGDRCGCPDCRHPPVRSHWSTWPESPWFIHPMAASLINFVSIATIIFAIVAFL